PWGLKRFYGSGDLHFITSSCYRRQAFLASEQRRDLFLTVLEQVRQRYGFVVVGYVVMPEHFHLLLSEPEKGNPSVVMQALKLGFARRVLATRRRDDGRNPTSGLRRSPRMFVSCGSTTTTFGASTSEWRSCAYIHRNPVRRGLVESPEQWRWSSFRDYDYGESGPVRVNDWTVLKMKVRRA